MTRGSWTGKFIYALYHPLNILLLISISIFLMRIHIFTLIKKINQTNVDFLNNQKWNNNQLKWTPLKREGLFSYFTRIFFPIPIEYLLSSLFQSFICLIVLPYSTARAYTVLVNKEVFRVEHKYQGSLTFKSN